MRTSLLALCLTLLAPAAVTPQEPPDPGSGGGYFVFLYGHGPEWPEGTPPPKEALEGHFAYMDELTERQILVLGGPFTDGSGAMGILRSHSLAAARQIMEQDPGVQAGVFSLDVRPWTAAVAGCTRSPQPSPADSD